MPTNPKVSNDNLYDVDGWKYVVLLVFASVLIFDLLPITCFGILYGGILSEIGNEIQDTSTITSIFLMAMLFSGIPASQILKKTSYRITAFIGASTICMGAFLSIFVKSTLQLLFTYSILQGGGFGTLIIAVFAAFTEYFHNRRSFYLNLAYLTTGIMLIVTPSLIALCISYYGARGTLLLSCGLFLHMIPATLCLHPIKWHKKRKKEEPPAVEMTNKNTNNSQEIVVEGTAEINVQNQDTNSNKNLKIGNRIFKFCWHVYNTFDLDLFKDPVFINLVTGLALARVSGFIYVSYLPLLIKSVGISVTDTYVLMTIFVISDLGGKAFLCILTAFTKIKNRHIVLVSTTVMCLFRLTQVFYHSFTWMVVICCALGFVRCFVENTALIIFSEMYPTRFITALPLAMIINALMAFLVGQILRYFTSITENKNVILIVLSIIAGWCTFAWLFELNYKYIKSKIRRK